MKKIFTFIAAVCFAGSMMAAEALNIDFTAGQGEWVIDNVLLPEGTEFIWAQTSQYGMKATAYFESANHASEAWLISPSFSLDGMTSATLSISHARRYGSNDQLSVVVKSANDADWTPLTVSAWPDGSSWTFIDATADLSEYAGDPSVQIAFVYTSTDAAAATWEIKTVKISNEDTPEPPAEEADVVLTSEEFNGKGTSGSGSEVKVEKGGITFLCDKAFGDQYGVRCYKNSNVSITSSEKQIGKIVFEFATVSGIYYDGGLDNEVCVNGLEWKADSLASQARMNKVKIYFGSCEAEEIEEITVTKAMELGEALADNAFTEKAYAVKGYVISAKEYDTGYNNQTFYMSDDATAERGEFTAYRSKVAAPGVKAGDLVRVIGKIQKYVGDYGTTIEITGGEVEAATEGIENIVLTEKAQKVTVDGVLYIIRDNKMYNVQGLQVR